MKVICAAGDCEFNNDDYICTASSISLSEHYIHTAHDGFQRFNRCRTYEQSEESKRLDELIRKHFEEKT